MRKLLFALCIVLFLTSCGSNSVNYEWYQGRYYSDVENSNHWINFCEAEDGLYVSVPGYSFRVEQPEVIESKEYGTVLRYRYNEETGRFDFMIDYMVERDEIIVLYTNYTYQSSKAVDYSGVYTYNDTLTNNSERDSLNSQKESEQCFYDGQRFECFETAGGEDLILTIRLFYENQGEAPSAYKGELSNGVEFWFEYYGNETSFGKSAASYTKYRILCEDNSMAYLKANFDTSEIIFVAEEGNEYGNMYAYSGTYIGLPDTSE